MLSKVVGTSLVDDALHKLRSLEARLPAAIATYFKAGFVCFPLFFCKKKVQWNRNLKIFSEPLLYLPSGPAINSRALGYLSSEFEHRRCKDWSRARKLHENSSFDEDFKILVSMAKLNRINF
jgi:hypothetical protein